MELKLEPRPDVPAHVTVGLNAIIAAYNAGTLKGAMAVALVLGGRAGEQVTLQPIAVIGAENSMIRALIRDEAGLLLTESRFDTVMGRKQAVVMAEQEERNAEARRTILAADGTPLN